MKTTFAVAFALTVAIATSPITSAQDYIYAPANLDGVASIELREELAYAAPNYDVLDRASQVDVYARVWSTHNQTSHTPAVNGLYADRGDNAVSSQDVVFEPGAVFEPYRRYYDDRQQYGYDYSGRSLGHRSDWRSRDRDRHDIHTPLGFGTSLYRDWQGRDYRR